MEWFIIVSSKSNLIIFVLFVACWLSSALVKWQTNKQTGSLQKQAKISDLYLPIIVCRHTVSCFRNRYQNRCFENLSRVVITGAEYVESELLRFLTFVCFMRWNLIPRHDCLYQTFGIMVKTAVWFLTVQPEWVAHLYISVWTTEDSVGPILFGFKMIRACPSMIPHVIPEPQDFPTELFFILNQKHNFRRKFAYQLDRTWFCMKLIESLLIWIKVREWFNHY